MVTNGMLNRIQATSRSPDSSAPYITYNAAESDTRCNSYKRLFLIIVVILSVRPIRALVSPALRVEQGYYPC